MNVELRAKHNYIWELGSKRPTVKNVSFKNNKESPHSSLPSYLGVKEEIQGCPYPSKYSQPQLVDSKDPLEGI